MASLLLFSIRRLLFVAFVSLSFTALACFRLISPFFLLVNFFLILCAAHGLWLSLHGRGGGVRDVIFSLDITATYHLSGQIESAATFTRRLCLPARAFSCEAARAAMLAALPDLHVVDEASQDRMLRDMLRYCDYWVPWYLKLDDRRGFNGDWILKPCYDFYIDELPPVTEFYVGALPPGAREGSVDDDDDEDDMVGFSRLSEDSIAGLEKEKIEEAVTCGVCLTEAPIGSEVTRLPCSHCFHAECIVAWFERSNLCPHCRFELP